MVNVCLGRTSYVLNISEAAAAPGGRDSLGLRAVKSMGHDSVKWEQ